MTGDFLLNLDGSRLLNADGSRAIASGNCRCCGGPTSTCTRCPGPTPSAISVAFSGVQFRSLSCGMCGNETYSWLINPNGVFTLSLGQENEFGCSFGLSVPQAVRRRIYANPGCTSLIQTQDFPLGISASFTTGTAYSIQAFAPLPAIVILFDHVSSGAVCIRDRTYLNQRPAFYQNGCDMGGGGGQATISF